MNPNLLRVTRWCAKWASGFLLVATLFAIGFREAPLMAAADRGLPETYRYRGRKEPVAPAAVTDLRAAALSDSAVVLQWTEVRSSTTAIPRYAIRYDLLGHLSWGSETDVLVGGCAAPVVGSNTSGGRPHACVVTGLSPQMAYEFQLVAYTGILGSTAVFGPLSNVAVAITMQRLGPALVWRPGIFRDTISVRTVVTPWGSWQLSGRVQLGDYPGSALDSAGQTTARAWLVLTRP